MTHQAQVPRLVADYFRRFVPGYIGDRDDHPIIIDVYWSGARLAQDELSQAGVDLMAAQAARRGRDPRHVGVSCPAARLPDSRDLPGSPAHRCNSQKGHSMTRMAATNVVAVVGRLTRPPAVKELPSGERLVSYEVMAERSEVVPVLWFGAPLDATNLDVDDVVVVVGRVRRRFYRAGGATRSRTEVVAETVVSGDVGKASAALASACARLQACIDDDSRQSQKER